MSAYSVALLLLTVLLGAGCSTMTTVQEVDTAAYTPGESALLLSYLFEADAEASRKYGCNLKIVEMASKKEYSFEIRTDHDSALLPLPPGRYSGNFVECPGRLQWDAKKIFAKPVVVKPGKTSVLGRVEIRITPNFDAMNLSFSDRRASVAALRDLLARLHEERKANLISALSGKPVTPEMVAADPSPNSFEFRVQGRSRASEGTDKLIERLNACHKKDYLHSPMRLGTLKYQVSYRGRKLESLQTVEDANAFSDELIACTGAALRSFVPATPESLYIEVTF